MKILHLPLKEKWYRMIQSGVKKEEYREIGIHWVNRLTEFGYEPTFWSVTKSILDNFNKGEKVKEIMDNYHIRFRFGTKSKNDYTHVHFTCGYPRKDDADKNLTIEINDMYIGQGKPEWGAEEGKWYFVIKI